MSEILGGKFGVGGIWEGNLRRRRRLPKRLGKWGEFEAPAAPLGGKYGTPQGPLGPEILGVPSDGGGFSLPTLR